MNEIGKGVKTLKDIAMGMNTELDKQNEALTTLETNVDKALDELDNVNVKMKNIIEKVIYFWIQSNAGHEGRQIHGELYSGMHCVGFNCLYCKSILPLVVIFAQ